MTEADWLTGTDFTAHVRFAEQRISLRRKRLVAVGFCRAAAPLFQLAGLELAFTLLEHYADGLMPEAEAEKIRQRYRERAQESYELFRASVDHGPEPDSRAYLRAELAWVLAYAFNYYPGPLDEIGTRAAVAAFYESTGRARTIMGDDRREWTPTAEQALVLRGVVWDVVGNPFRSDPFPNEWRTDTVVALARQMYVSREFGAMPILADALQDAGCADDDVLNHCRHTTLSHVRGCWVVDRVLELS